MSDTADLANKSCQPCQGGIAALSAEAAQKFHSELHADWVINPDATALTRRLEFKGYTKAVYHANLVAWLSDQQGHHADVTFGWGYCHVTFTTHDIGGLSENDFICAARFDRLISGT